MNVQEQVEKLEALGMKQAGANLKSTAEFNRKCLIAYENFRYVTSEKINEFNTKLKDKTYDKATYSYDTLTFDKLEAYPKIPPQSVLDLLETAKGRDCFDYFEVAHIVRKVETPDPILFGCINGCKDRFFVGQWDSDVSIEDILKDNEG